MGACAVILASSVVLAGPEDADEWDQHTPISVSITSPADNTYLPINTPQGLLATATDWDCYRVGSNWYKYQDHVEQEDADEHMWWTADPEVGELTDMYGTGAMYKAPGYSEGQDERNVVISCHADDNNTGSDSTWGADDTAQQASITLKVWQVKITIQMDGTTSGNYDGTPTPASRGGTDLGSIKPGEPVGCERYGGNTQITGSIPPGLPVIDEYLWYQDFRGFA